MSAFKIQEIPVPRVSLCRSILKKLPEWFGIESALENYAADTDKYPTFGAYDSDERLIGFLTLRAHNQSTNEVHVIAVDPSFHGLGVGRMLIKFAIAQSRAEHFEPLEVKTLGPSKPDPFYDRTRAFYLREGFRPVEEFLGVWGENPCLVMVLPLLETKV
jgi:GNAT superfamily N-acetyltransferase